MPAQYLLDTNICIYIARHHPPEVRRRFEELAVGTTCMSVVTYGELCYGAEKSARRSENLDLLARFTEMVPVLPLPVQASSHYGKIRAGLARNGCPIGANDLWIAAHAMAADLVLVSNNLREFDRIDGLKTENWITG